MRKLLIALLCVSAVFAQDKIQKVVTIKNGNLKGIWSTLKELAPTNGMAISASDNDHLILSGPKDSVAGFEEIIKQLDVAPAVQNNVEIDAYMVIASAHAENRAAMPAELDPVVAQLKALFSYKTFRLLDNFVLRARSGERGENSGSVQPNTPAPEGAQISYRFDFNKVRVGQRRNRAPSAIRRASPVDQCSGRSGQGGKIALERRRNPNRCRCSRGKKGRDWQDQRHRWCGQRTHPRHFG